VRADPRFAELRAHIWANCRRRTRHDARRSRDVGAGRTERRALDEAGSERSRAKRLAMTATRRALQTLAIRIVSVTAVLALAVRRSGIDRVVHDADRDCSRRIRHDRQRELWIISGQA